MTVVGVDTTVLFVGVLGLLIAGFAILVIVAPWKSVRDDGPLPEDVETRLLLGEDPEQVAADVDREQSGGASVRDLTPDEPNDTSTTTGDAYAELTHLDDAEPPRDSP